MTLWFIKTSSTRLMSLIMCHQSYLSSSSTFNCVWSQSWASAKTWKKRSRCTSWEMKRSAWSSRPSRSLMQTWSHNMMKTRSCTPAFPTYKTRSTRWRMKGSKQKRRGMSLARKACSQETTSIVRSGPRISGRSLNQRVTCTMTNWSLPPSSSRVCSL